MKKNSNKKLETKWIMQQSQGVRWKLSILGITRIAFVVVNLVMSVVLSQFTEYAIGNAKYSMRFLLFLALSVFLLEGVAYVVESILKKSIYSQMEKKIRIHSLEALQKSNVFFLQQYHSSELLTRLTKDTEQVSNCLQNLIINVFGGIVMAIAAFSYMMVLSWKLSIIIIIAIPVLGVLVSLFSPLLQKYNELDKKNEDRNRIEMRELVGNISLSQVYRAEGLLRNKVDYAYEKKQKSAIRLGVVEGFFSFFNNLTGSIMFLIVMGVGAYLTTKGEFSVGSMIAVINLLNYIVWPFANISNSISDFNQALISANRIMELNQFPKVQQLQMREAKGEEEKAEQILVEDMSFYYKKETPIFSHLNMKFEKNGMIGVVGKSGGGKSTFLKLLLNIYKPQEGKVQYINTSNADGAEEEPMIALVPSSDYIFSGTVKENIGMSEQVDEARMIDAAKRANADGFICAMQNQYEEPIGDGGNALSSGQAQRIAIARAYYHNARCVIFDEPTSNLDQVSIEKFIGTIKEMSKNCLCMIATHDRSVIEVCERVIVIDEMGVRDVERDAVQNYIEE